MTTQHPGEEEMVQPEPTVREGQMIGRCEWRDDPEIGLWHLPGCWGAVVGGPECCYCGDEEGSSVDARLAALEAITWRLASILLGSTSSEAPSPKSEPQASAFAPATDEPTNQEGEA